MAVLTVSSNCQNEEDIKALDFVRTTIWRPGLLDRGDKARFVEKVARYGLGLILNVVAVSPTIYWAVLCAVTLSRICLSRGWLMLCGCKRSTFSRMKMPLSRWRSSPTRRSTPSQRSSENEATQLFISFPVFALLSQCSPLHSVLAWTQRRRHCYIAPFPGPYPVLPSQGFVIVRRCPLARAEAVVGNGVRGVVARKSASLLPS